MKTIFILLITLLEVNFLIAQNSVSGKIIDKSTGNTVSDVIVTLDKSQNKTITDENGVFIFENITFPIEISLDHLGFEKQQLTIQSNDIQPIEIFLNPVAVHLSEINILEDLAQERKNPVSFTSISAKKISTELGDRPLPEILENTPGVYASRDGGGSGDASVMIRGFGQENIAVLLNGVPINGAENGLVYWNNWMGLAEIAGSIQVQKGIGASKVALNSVGGTINIVTKKPKLEKGGSVSFNLTNYGNRKTTFTYNTGKMKNGINVNLLFSRTVGVGYIDATYVNGWAYFLNLSKQLNDKQYLTFTLLGGPETHGQRNLKLSKDEIDHFGNKYNKEWGSLNGEIKNASENFYHKPFMALNHFFTPNSTTTIANSIYFSPGWGGGKWNDSFNYGPGIFEFRNASGQIDWDSIHEYNKYNKDQFTLENGETVSQFSKVVQTDFLANHIWAGIVSNIEKEFNHNIKLISGLHYRYFKSSLTEKVSDLLGGGFYIDDYSWSLAGVAGREEIKMPGDKIRIDNGALLHQISAFAQLEKQISQASLFLAGTISNSSYRRHDIYNYPTDKWSIWVNKPAFDIKAGVNLNINEKQNVYMNGGFFSKAPYYKYVFGNFTNVPTYNIHNEKVTTFEVGYAYKSNKMNVLANTYYTNWKDVAFLSNEYIPLENQSQTRAMVSGLDAIHIGTEVESNFQILKNLSVGAFISVGDWRWNNDVEAKLFDDHNQVVDTVHVYAKGLYVGGQPQLQTGILLNGKILDLFFIKFDISYNDKNFAMFDPGQRNNPDDRSQPFELPSYFLSNIRLQFPIMLHKNESVVFANLNNLFNTSYILKGEDGSLHDLNSFSGFWSFGRTFDLGFKLYF